MSSIQSHFAVFDCSSGHGTKHTVISEDDSGGYPGRLPNWEFGVGVSALCGGSADSTIGGCVRSTTFTAILSLISL